MIVNNFYVSLRHTKKVEIDPNVHKLPPDWGAFDEYKVADYNCPEEWSNDGYFVPADEGIPLWIDLTRNPNCAVILSVQRFNPVSNEPANLDEGLKKDPQQNYMVLPKQKWIDGYTKEGKVYQFVVTKAGEGLAVNEFVLPKEMQDSHAIGLAFYLPKCSTSYAPSRNYVPIYSGLDSTGNNRTTGPLVVGAQGARSRHTQNKTTSPDFPDWSQPYNNLVKVKSVTYPEHSLLSPQSIEAGIDPTSYHLYQSLEATDLGTTLDDCNAVVDILEDQTENQTQECFDKASMGAGGRIDQKIETDPNTVEFYQKTPALVLPIYLAMPDQFKHIMSQGKKQDAARQDKYVHSGQVGGVQVPLI